MLEEKAAKKISRPLAILLEDHEVVEVDVGGEVSTEFDADWGPISNSGAEPSLLFYRRDLHGERLHGSYAANKEFTQIRLHVQRHAAPFVQ
ncbi:hypothetical protein CKJ55_12665 [Mycobacterium avium]|uniref:Uncharacterized protein n=3 Tax=Mycobacterium avium complex (MAC) TaxID=120793 RepID=A0A3B6X7H4_MYCAV|nr:hypothetical protein [Mycobacterium avium]KDO99009.1 hypothetical protein MAV3388_13135 [Mycobacterium avium subsp. hominissuis 3388]ORA41931.1 hypothetical protein BST19_27095 [Mycobacterium bouchedurhonense]AXO23186.1 hypothetical protein DFS55_11855 [Mycobacterium avium subsp. hominissuis]PBA26808.1 hypothetical protein CKJ66_10325 [Mycobacterium avium]PBA41142.1 hypothetical protein CKJ63_13310 [Mycobacterium avium]